MKPIPFLVISLLLGLTLPVQAQPDKPIFGTVELRTGFQPDPLEINGISGGSILISSLVDTNGTPTGNCVGYTEKEPDAGLNLTTPFNHLQIQVQSDSDTTLMVQGPGGVWCNDDNNSKNPSISGEWLSGYYRVWVGSYQPNIYQPYRIVVTQKRE